MDSVVIVVNNGNESREIVDQIAPQHGYSVSIWPRKRDDWSVDISGLSVQCRLERPKRSPCSKQSRIELEVRVQRNGGTGSGRVSWLLL